MVKRDRFIKIMLTEREFKRINRYASLVFQTKSEFIRSAIRRRIAEINKSIYPELPPLDPDSKPLNLRKLVMGELKDALNEYEDGIYLQKVNEEVLKTREEEKKRREKELTKIRQALEKRE